MFTRLYGLPKERQTGFSNNACSCLRCASCVKLSSDNRGSVLLYTHEVWVWFPVCPFIRGTFVQS